MAEEIALGNKLIRECILSHISDQKDLKTIALLNSKWYQDAIPRLESTSYLAVVNHHIIKYTDDINNGIITGKYLRLVYTPETKVPMYKLAPALKPKIMERIPQLEPRVDMLIIDMGNSMTAFELATLLKSSTAIRAIRWIVYEFPNKDKLVKIFEEVSSSLKSANCCFQQLKSAHFKGNTEPEFDFWADYFPPLLANLEELQVYSNPYQVNKFLLDIEKLKVLEQLRAFKISVILADELWDSFLSKSLSIRRLEICIYEGNIPYLNQLWEKYGHQLEKLRLGLHLNFDELTLPPMSNLRYLEISWCMVQGEDLKMGPVIMSDDLDAYPKLREVKIVAFNIETIMTGFRVIAGNVGISTSLRKVTAHYSTCNSGYFAWMDSGKDKGILKELNWLFPNAENKMHYDQMDDDGYPDNLESCKAPEDQERSSKCGIL